MLPTENCGIITPRDIRRRLNQLRCQQRGCPCRETANKGHGLTHCPLHPLRPEHVLTLTVLPDFTMLADCSEGCEQMRLWRALFGDVFIAWEKARWADICDPPKQPRKPKELQGVEAY